MAIYKGEHKVADKLPEINSGTSGKVLSNDGSKTEWSTVSVPTKVSELENDAGYVTDGYHDNTKLDKSTIANTAYTVNGSGEQSNTVISSDVVVNSIPLRDSNGHFNVNTPVSNNNPATKGYVDSGLSNKQNTISDLEEIRSGAGAGLTALQPNDNISELNNDSNYQTGIQVDTSISTHNTSSAAHSDIRSAINEKQDTLTAGTNISIASDGKTISATDTTYSAGNGLTLTGTEFSANVIDNVTSTSSTNALSANMGKELQDQIDNLKARGRYLSQWNATTGQPATQPTQLPYPYKTGDYYLVGTVGEVNYKPTGTSYTGAASTEIEIAELAIDDTYFFDGTIWHLQQNTQKIVTFASLAGQPTDNTNLAAALNDKVTKNNTITGATHTKITYDSKGLVTAGADLAESDIPALHLSKITDITATATELNYVDGVTSAIQTQLNSKAADNAVVHTTGNESISGTKTFNDTLELKSNLSFRSYGTNNSGRLQFRAQPSDNVIRGTMAITDGYSTSGSGYNGFVAQMVARSGSTSSDPFNTVRVSNKGIEYIKEANDGTITGQYVVVDDSGLVPSDRLATSGSTGQVLTKTASGQSWQTIDVSDEVNSLISVMLATLYPVGSIYIGTQSTCPISTLIPGSTWELVSAGRTLQGADSSHTAGSTIEAGLPNITGEFAGNGWIMTQTNNTTKGAITTGSTTSIHYGGTSGSGVDRFFVDASNSNPIYGKSTTVQPPAYVVNIWRRTA